MKASSEGIKKFLYYIHERENIRLKKESGAPWPWTKDEILQKYSFTNVRRVNDRTTQAFLAIYKANVKPGKYEQALLNCATFRYFGTAGFAQAVGWQARWQAARVLRVAKERLQSPVERVRGPHKRVRVRQEVFTGAYVITNGGRKEPKEDVVVDYLSGLAAAYKERLAPLLKFKSPSWAALGEEMMKLEGFGGTGFMVKEVLQDFILCYPGLFWDEETWTPVGPGARRGLNYIAGRDPDFTLNSHTWLEEVVALRVLVNQNWTKWFPNSGTLSAHDVQFCLCEHAKRMKVVTGVGKPRSTYLPPHQRPHERNGIEIA